MRRFVGFLHEIGCRQPAIEWLLSPLRVETLIRSVASGLTSLLTALTGLFSRSVQEDLSSV